MHAGGRFRKRRLQASPPLNMDHLWPTAAIDRTGILTPSRGKKAKE
jgi:hypothetical protein